MFITILLLSVCFSLSTAFTVFYEWIQNSIDSNCCMIMATLFGFAARCHSSLLARLLHCKPGKWRPRIFLSFLYYIYRPCPDCTFISQKRNENVSSKKFQMKLWSLVSLKFNVLMSNLAETATSSLLFVTDLSDNLPVPPSSFYIFITTLILILNKFFESIYHDYIFTGNYKVQLYDPRTGGFMPSSPGIGMHVEVKDPDDKVVLSRVRNLSINVVKLLKYLLFHLLITLGLQLWRQIHFYFSHSWRTCHLPVFKQHQVVFWHSVGKG